MGATGFVLGTMSLFGYRAAIAIAAILVGGFSVYRAVRDGEYEYLFLGMVGILMALIAIWQWATVASAFY
jgi:hypothetical protein